MEGRFQWQEGYGAFSYGKSQISDVARYIETQADHHAKQTFVDEYKEFLTKFDVPYEDKYIFHAVEQEPATPIDASLRDAMAGGGAFSTDRGIPTGCGSTSSPKQGAQNEYH